MILFRTAAAATAVLIVQAAAPMAMAHTAYLLPNTFDAERTRVTLQGALTEDDYFNPDIGLAAPAYVETLPSGQTAQVAPAILLKDLTVTEVALDAAGTYRFSTGQFVTRKSTFADVGGKWLMVRQPRPGARPGGDGDGPPSILEPDVPADAQRMQADNIMITETYVSKGAPTDAALKTTGQGFELKPVTHPNAVYVDQGFAFQLLVDGAPAANLPISVYREGNIYDDKRIAVELHTDAKGAAKVAFAQPGIYLLTTHYPVAPRAPGEAPPVHSYVYSLTFEVTR